MGDGALRLSPPAPEFGVKREFFFFCVELAALSSCVLGVSVCAWGKLA